MKKYFLFPFFVLAAINAVIAQNTVDGYMVRNNPEHSFMGNLTINPVNVELEPSNGSLGCYLGLKVTTQNKFSIEARTHIPYFNFIHWTTDYDPTSSTIGNSVNG